MKQTSKRLMSLALTAVFIVAALVVFWNFVQPEYGNMETLMGQAIGAQNLLASEQQAAGQVQALLASYKSQSDPKAAYAVPSGQDLAGALAQVYGLAQNSGIVVQSVNIGAPALTQPAAQQLVKPLGTISLQVSATGSYEALKNFLSGLETNVRIFDLKSLSLAPGQVKNFFNYNLIVATYYQPWQ